MHILKYIFCFIFDIKLKFIDLKFIVGKIFGLNQGRATHGWRAVQAARFQTIYTEAKVKSRRLKWVGHVMRASSIY